MAGRRAAGRAGIGAGRLARLISRERDECADFCLGDTGAMAGHSPAAVVAAVARRYGELGGATTMLPTPDTAWVGTELARRLGPQYWSFALTATANRWATRIARHLTGRPRICVLSYCYHGPGACTRARGLDPDVVTIGKSIAGGIPAGAYGLSGPLAQRILAGPEADIEDTGGVGGTLAGSALSVAAMRATLAFAAAVAELAA